MKTSEFERDGVAVTYGNAAARRSRPALIFVHGGGHASWCWEKLLPFFGDKDWECLAFDWFNHGRSRSTSAEAFLHRSIADVTEEMGIVAELASGVSPILVGHGMGGAACLAYAVEHDVEGLVLINPVVPAGLGAVPIDVPIDPNVLFGPISFAMARPMFFAGLDESTARRYHALLTAESPVAAMEANRWSLKIDLDAIDTDVLVFAGNRDIVCPAHAVASLARTLGAEYVLMDDCGHDDALLSDRHWPVTASRMSNWLRLHRRRLSRGVRY